SSIPPWRNAARSRGLCPRNRREQEVIWWFSYARTQSNSEAIRQSRSDATLRTDPPPNLAKALKIGIPRLEGRPRLASILGEIDTAAGGGNQHVNFVEKGENAFIHRKVECEGKSWARKRHEPSGGRAQFLQDGEEGGVAALGDTVKNFADRILRVFGRYDALMLQETAPTIYPVPMVNSVEGKEKSFGIIQER